MNQEIKEAALNTKEKSIPRKRQRENTGSQTNEDCVSGHCCDASASITKLEAKIDKLLDLFTEIASLKVRLTEVEEENKHLRKAAEYTGKELTDLKTCLANMCSQSASGTDEMQSLNMEIQQLKCRNIKLEAYTRRESIKIYNLQEIEGETPGDTEDLVRSMMEEKMKISSQDINDIRFERVHRLPTRRNPRRSTNTRPVIAKFSFYQDKEFVLSKVKNLKGTKTGISHDYPKEIEAIHTKLYPVLKKAKQEKQSAFFKVDKLIINGQVYNGVETENLLYYGSIMSST